MPTLAGPNRSGSGPWSCLVSSSSSSSFSSSFLSHLGGLGRSFVVHWASLWRHWVVNVALLVSFGAPWVAKVAILVWFGGSIWLQRPEKVIICYRCCYPLIVW